MNELNDSTSLIYKTVSRNRNRASVEMLKFKTIRRRSCLFSSGVKRRRLTGLVTSTDARAVGRPRAAAQEIPKLRNRKTHLLRFVR